MIVRLGRHNGRGYGPRTGESHAPPVREEGRCPKCGSTSSFYLDCYGPGGEGLYEQLACWMCGWRAP